MHATDIPLLRAEHLTRAVGERLLVDDVSIEVWRGDVVGIVGPSGAGKSSFLRLLNRLDEPTGGTVYLEGRDYRSLTPRELRRRVGMVMQTAALFPGTVAENVAFGPRQHGGTIAAETISTLLRQVGLPGFEQRDAEELSGGEAQRVAIARALANEPSVLLLDEPTSALDDASKRGVEALIREVIRGRGLTCLVITHDMAQAARMSNRVLALSAGRVQRIGDVREVLRAGYDLP